MLFFFFFNDTATTEIYTLSLHDALPICERACASPVDERPRRLRVGDHLADRDAVQGHSRVLADAPTNLVGDRKSTRLNSSHSQISYAVFCLKKKKQR